MSGLTVEKNDDNSQLQADSSSTNDDSNQQYYDTNFQSAIEMSGTDNGNNDLVAARNIDADYRNGAGKKKKHYSKQNSKRMGSQHHRGHANGDNVDEQISQIVELKMNVNNKGEYIKFGDITFQDQLAWLIRLFTSSLASCLFRFG